MSAEGEVAVVTGCASDGNAQIVPIERVGKPHEVARTFARRFAVNHFGRNG